MASCITDKWATSAPQLRLKVVEQVETATTVTLSWQLYYISTTAVVDISTKKAFTVRIDNTIVGSGLFDLYEKLGIHIVAVGKSTITKQTAARQLAFEVAFTFDMSFDTVGYIGTKTAYGSLLIGAAGSTQPATKYTACGVPTNLSIIDNGNNTITLSCTAGADGINNVTDGIDFYVTYDGTTPSTSNYAYMKHVAVVAGATALDIISFSSTHESAMVRLLGASCIGTVKVLAVTSGDAGSKYTSAPSAVKSTVFTWYGVPSSPTVSISSAIAGKLTSYKVTWSAGASGINNAINYYTLTVFDLDTNAAVASYNTSNLSCSVAADTFTAGHKYRFDVVAVGMRTGLSSVPSSSVYVAVKDIDKFQNLMISAVDSTTVPSTCVPGSRTYIDIGSGNVLKLAWDTPTALNNEISGYTVYINKFDTTTGVSTSIFMGDIGTVNEFYITSTMLSTVLQQNFVLRVYLSVNSKFGLAYGGTSNIVELNISRCRGAYIKVSDGYKQPIMKRAVTFAKLPSTAILAADGSAMLDNQGKQLYAKTTSLQSADTGWAIMQELYSKDSVNNTWHSSDVRYEVLVDSTGDVITDTENEPIYIL